jgi:ElaB/YqjD/DUF883 family membrane-anchored ribosome-binding protein
MTTITSGASGPDTISGSMDSAARYGNSENRAGSSGDTSAAVDRIAGGAHEAVDRIAAVATSAASQLNVRADDLMAAKERWMQTCSTYVKDNPFTALGIAVAAGFMLSRWVR